MENQFFTNTLKGRIAVQDRYASIVKQHFGRFIADDVACWACASEGVMEAEFSLACFDGGNQRGYQFGERDPNNPYAEYVRTRLGQRRIVKFFEFEWRHKNLVDLRQVLSGSIPMKLFEFCRDQALISLCYPCAMAHKFKWGIDRPTHFDLWILTVALPEYKLYLDSLTKIHFSMPEVDGPTIGDMIEIARRCKE